MRALRCNEYGSPETLVLEDLPDPVPGPGEVVVDIVAAAANFPDVLLMARIPLNLVLLKGPWITGFTMQGIAGNRAEDVARHEAELWDLLARGKLVPHIGARFPLEEGARALNELAERRATGKVLVVPAAHAR